MDNFRRAKKLSLAKIHQNNHLTCVRAIANNGKNLENSVPEAQYAPGGECRSNVSSHDRQDFPYRNLPADA
jgi:hypothetical protein